MSADSTLHRDFNGPGSQKSAPISKKPQSSKTEEHLFDLQFEISRIEGVYSISVDRKNTIAEQISVIAKFCSQTNEELIRKSFEEVINDFKDFIPKKKPSYAQAVSQPKNVIGNRITEALIENFDETYSYIEESDRKEIDDEDLLQVLESFPLREDLFVDLHAPKKKQRFILVPKGTKEFKDFYRAICIVGRLIKAEIREDPTLVLNITSGIQEYYKTNDKKVLSDLEKHIVTTMTLLSMGLLHLIGIKDSDSNHVKIVKIYIDSIIASIFIEQYEGLSGSEKTKIFRAETVSRDLTMKYLRGLSSREEPIKCLLNAFDIGVKSFIRRKLGSNANPVHKEELTDKIVNLIQVILISTKEWQNENCKKRKRRANQNDVSSAEERGQPLKVGDEIIENDFPTIYHHSRVPISDEERVIIGKWNVKINSAFNQSFSDINVDDNQTPVTNWVKKNKKALNDWYSKTNSVNQEIEKRRMMIIRHGYFLRNSQTDPTVGKLTQEEFKKAKEDFLNNKLYGNDKTVLAILQSKFSVNSENDIMPTPHVHKNTDKNAIKQLYSNWKTVKPIFGSKFDPEKLKDLDEEVEIHENTFKNNDHIFENPIIEDFPGKLDKPDELSEESKNWLRQITTFKSFIDQIKKDNPNFKFGSVHIEQLRQIWNDAVNDNLLKKVANCFILMETDEFKSSIED